MQVIREVKDTRYPGFSVTLTLDNGHYTLASRHDRSVGYRYSKRSTSEKVMRDILLDMIEKDIYRRMVDLAESKHRGPIHFFVWIEGKCCGSVAIDHYDGFIATLKGMIGERSVWLNLD